MTPERFETLAEAYGGDVARWPAAERDAAAALMAARSAWARGVLGRAGELDGLLAAFEAPRPRAGLAERIAATGPRSRAPRWRAWLVPAAMGAGLAAACAAGVLTGSQLGAPGLARPDGEALVTAVDGEDYALDLDEDA